MAGIRDGDCLCNRPGGVTYLEILGQRVGVSGLESLFARWRQAGRQPQELSAAEVLDGLRKANYVSESAAADYVEGARAAYARWRSLTAKECPDAQG